MASNSSPVDLCSSSSNSEDEESADAVEEEELNPGPSKKPKKQLGAGSYKTKFNKQWIQEYPFIQASTNSIYKFYCTMCSRDVGCGHMGRADVERHIQYSTQVTSPAGTCKYHNVIPCEVLLLKCPVQDLRVTAWITTSHVSIFTCQ